MAKLNAVIAIEKGIKARAHSVISDLFKAVQKPALFAGLTRTFRPKDDTVDALPAERTHVQLRVQDVLVELRKSTSELIDVVVQKDVANCKATGQVTIDGDAVLPPLPATSLLMLEKQLTDLRTFIAAIPVLDSAESWRYDENADLHVTDPVETRSTRKAQTPIVLYAATEHHPAQTQLITEDVTVGYWQAVKQSGALPRPAKVKMAERCEKLLLAVKEARERANDVDAGDRPKVGDAIFTYLLS